MMPVRSFRHFVRSKAAIDDRLLHRYVIPGGAAAVKPQRSAVDRLFGVERRRALDLLRGSRVRRISPARVIPERPDARLAVTSWVFDPDRGHNADAGDDDAPHNDFHTLAPLKLAPLVRPASDLALGRTVHMQISFTSYIRLAIGLQPTIGNAEGQLAPEHPFHVHAVDDPFDGGKHLIGEFDLADAERPAATGQAEPAQKKSCELPERVRARDSPA